MQSHASASGNLAQDFQGANVLQSDCKVFNQTSSWNVISLTKAVGGLRQTVPVRRAEAFFLRRGLYVADGANLSTSTGCKPDAHH